MAQKKASAAASTPKPAKPKKQVLSLMSAWESSHAKGAQATLSAPGDDGKRMRRFAFSGAHQDFGPYDALSNDRFEALVGELWALANALWPAKDQTTGDARLTRLAQVVAQGMHSHLGKYVHPESSEKWLASPSSEPLPFLCSQSVGEVRWMSAGFAHKPAMTGASLIFHAHFKRLVDGSVKIVSLPWLLARGDAAATQALQAAGLAPSEIQSASAVFAQAFGSASALGERSGSLPTLRLPTFDQERRGWTYQSIVALPALACYNAISRMRSIAFDHGMRPSMTRFSVGSGQAQNISVASTHTGGSLPLLMCEPPRILTTGLSGMIRKAARKKGLGILIEPAEEKVAELSALAEAIKPWPNANRESKMKSLARAWVEDATDQAQALAQALAAQEEGAQAEGANRQELPANVPPFLRSALLGLGVDKEDRQRWFDALLGSEGIKALAAHTQEDQRSWRAGAAAALIDAFGVKASAAASPIQSSQGGAA